MSSVTENCDVTVTYASGRQEKYTVVGFFPTSWGAKLFGNDGSTTYLYAIGGILRIHAQPQKVEKAPESKNHDPLEQY